MNRKSRWALMMAIVVVCFAGGTAWGTITFTDIDGTGSHKDNILAIAEAGITSGCTPTTYCPDNNVTRAQMATFLARLGGFSSGTTKNFPKANGRSQLQAYCAVAAANYNSFDHGPCAGTALRLDGAANDVGWQTSIAIGAHGLPVITYHDNTNVTVKIATCATTSCSGTPTVTSVLAGYTPSIAVGANGLPIVSFFDFTNLIVAACTTTDCSGTPTTTNVDAALNVGQYSSIAVGPNGLPIISYRSGNATGDVRVAACTVANCTGSHTINTLDNSGAGLGLSDASQATSIAVGSNGLPIVAYYDASNHDLKVAACSSTNCGGSATLTVVDAAGDVGAYPSLTIGADGKPIISYYDATNHDLKVAACTTLDCSAATITAVDTGLGGDVGQYTSIALGTNGLPVVSYYSATNKFLKLARCSTRDCTGTARIDALDFLTGGDVGWYSSVAVGIDGVPTVSYYDTTNGDLKVARAAVS